MVEIIKMREKNYLMRVIMHVDMDEFFAAIEERENPSLKGKPVVVGANPKRGKGRGVVSTANYIARRCGIKSGMPISKAYKLCPDAIFLPVRISLYEKVSRSIMRILRKYSDKFEQVSIDEAFLDVSSKAKDWDEALELARKIKEEIREKEGLTCSIGISYNKLLAKIASGLEKPDGLVLIKPEDLEEKVWPLPTSKIWGIGPKTEARLKELGIKTIGDLARANPEILEEEFGSFGPRLVLLARGIDESPVEPRMEIKSIGREHTFERDTQDILVITNKLKELVSDVWRRARNKGFWFRTVTIKIRFHDFETHTHSKTFKLPIGNQEEFYDVSSSLLKPFLEIKKIRLIGVRVSNLSRFSGQKRLIDFLD